MKNKAAVLVFFLLFPIFSIHLFGQNTKNLDLQTKNIVIENTCKCLNQNYVFPDKANLIIDFIKQQNQNGAYDTCRTPNELTRQINKDIRSIYNDKHLRIDYDVDLEKDIKAFISSKKSANEIIKEDIEKDKKKNFHFRKVEILPSNIGYLQLNGFAVPCRSTSKTIHAAMQFVANTDALIIDLRNNFGGNGKVAGEILSYFFDKKTYTGRSFNKIENKWHKQYIDNDITKTKGLVMKMPLYILTSQRTFSAAEGFAYNLQHLKNATIIGEKTRGGAHLTRSFSLGNGFVGFIPYSRFESVITKTDWEGTGVTPTIIIPENDCLFTAQNKILENKKNNTTSEIEKNQVTYLINFLASKHKKFTTNDDIILKFLGEYEYFEVTLEGNQLFFMDKKNFKHPEKMIAITDTIYQIGEDYQIEFLIDKGGFCISMKMAWDDGYTEIILKNKK